MNGINYQVQCHSCINKEKPCLECSPLDTKWGDTLKNLIPSMKLKPPIKPVTKEDQAWYEKERMDVANG